MPSIYAPIPTLSPSDINRFYRYAPPADSNNCREWLAGRRKTDRPYGVFSLTCKQFIASRIAYFLHYGTDPGQLMVCHRCDNPPCVNPEHLFLGTNQVNILDAKEKGRIAAGDRHGSHLHPERWARGERSGSRLHPERIPRGERAGASKLTGEQVLQIRALRGQGIPQRKIGLHYNVSESLISCIWLRKIWTHI